MTYTPPRVSGATSNNAQRAATTRRANRDERRAMGPKNVPPISRCPMPGCDTSLQVRKEHPHQPGVHICLDCYLSINDGVKKPKRTDGNHLDHLTEEERREVLRKGSPFTWHPPTPKPETDGDEQEAAQNRRAIIKPGLLWAQLRKRAVDAFGELVETLAWFCSRIMAALHRRRHAVMVPDAWRMWCDVTITPWPQLAPGPIAMEVPEAEEVIQHAPMVLVLNTDAVPNWLEDFRVAHSASTADTAKLERLTERVNAPRLFRRPALREVIRVVIGEDYVREVQEERAKTEKERATHDLFEAVKYAVEHPKNTEAQILRDGYTLREVEDEAGSYILLASPGGKTIIVGYALGESNDMKFVSHKEEIRRFLSGARKKKAA